MDKNENPHCSASLQFSKLSAVPDDNSASASPDFSNQWTQFRQSQPAFQHLCSWNPMDVPDLTPLSEPLKVNSNPSSVITDFGVFNGNSDFLNHSQIDWHRENSSSQKFIVREDFARFDKQSQPSLQHDFQGTNCLFNCGDVDLGPQLHRRMSHPSFHNSFVGFETSDCHLQSNPPSKDLLSSTLMAENVLPEDVTIGDSTVDGRLSSEVSVENWSHVHFVHTPPQFSHATAHQLPTHSNQSSDNFPEISSCFSNTDLDDVTAYLQMFDPSSLNVDAGTKSDRHRCSNTKDTSISTGECSPCTINKHWNLLNSNKINSSGNLTTNQTQPLRRKLSSESPSSADLLKPSYSDIAKTQKSGPTFGAKSESSNSGGSPRHTHAKTLTKDERLFHPVGKTMVIGSKSVLKDSLGKEADQSRITAAPKYGLDSFTAQTGNYTINSENLAKVDSTRGSDNSVISSVSSPNEDILQRPADHISSEKNAFDHAEKVKIPVQQSNVSTHPAKPPLSSKPYSSLFQQTAPKKTVFFDPKRIFQHENTKRVQNPAPNLTPNKTRGVANTPVDPAPNLTPNKTRGVANTPVDRSGTTFTPGFIFNHGKPTASTDSSKLAGNARQRDYISNDLRDTSKLTNQTAASESGPGANCSRTEELLSEKESRLGKKPVERNIDTHPHKRGLQSNGDKAAKETSDDGEEVQHHNDHSWSGTERKKTENWCSKFWCQLRYYGGVCISSMLRLLIIVLLIILYIACRVILLLVSLIGNSWTFIKSRMFDTSYETKDQNTRSSHDFLPRGVGLEENICLPATGEEAMKRLLACKGQDPYSILGLRADSSSDDIKKYYRRQAILVHPDKNQEPGAEEAFKILGHAFEMIGEPEKRKQYDSHTLEANEMEAMREFAEMLSKLQAKFQEAANTMPCDNCRGKHRRVPVERPSYYARFCERCNTRHCAKEGDVWAETSRFGFYWHYFALMDGHVFDITEWMKCHEEYFSQMKANSHTVMYRISTEGYRRNRHHQQGDPNLEELINRLFKSNTPPYGKPNWATSHSGSEKPSTQGGTHEASASTTSAAAAKKGRRKKKRH